MINKYILLLTLIIACEICEPEYPESPKGMNGTCEMVK